MEEEIFTVKDNRGAIIPESDKELFDNFRGGL